MWGFDLTGVIGSWNLELGFWGGAGRYGDSEAVMGSFGGGVVGVCGEPCGRFACQSWYGSAKFSLYLCSVMLSLP